MYVELLCCYMIGKALDVLFEFVLKPNHEDQKHVRGETSSTFIEAA